MSTDVFWIKLQTSTFDSETIMLLESMPEGDSILIIWFKMQILAGKCNAGGYLLLNGERPYSDEMLATVFRRPLNTVRLAISAFLQFKMVEIIDEAYFLPEWEKHQNISGLDKIREQTRQRVARHRSKAKDVTLRETQGVTHGNATEQETESELERTTTYADVAHSTPHGILAALLALIPTTEYCQGLKKAVLAALEANGESYVRSNIDYCLLRHKNSAANNLGGMIVASLSNDYAQGRRLKASEQKRQKEIEQERERRLIETQTLEAQQWCNSVEGRTFEAQLLKQ